MAALDCTASGKEKPRFIRSNEKIVDLGENL